MANNDLLKWNLQMNTEIADNFIEDLNDLIRKYNIIPEIDNSRIILDTADLIHILNIYRMEEED